MKLIAIEGIDGAGKGTQAKLLRDRLTNDGYRVESISFPQYDNTVSGSLLREYLRGDLGPMESVHPKFAALAFATDRMESRMLLHAKFNDSDVVIADRYTASNIAHQSARRPLLADRESLKAWITKLENDFSHPSKADLTFLVDIPVCVAIERIQLRYKGTEKKPDLHESRPEYLMTVREVYLDLARSLGWTVINGTLPPEAVAKKIHEQSIAMLSSNCVDPDALNRVARAIHKEWSEKSWDDASASDHADAYREAAAAINAMHRKPRA